jgi:hypothetical protein
MAFDIHAASSSPPAETSADYDSRLGPNWGERIVTVIAASAAVLIVATIAVLMGMA